MEFEMKKVVGGNNKRRVRQRREQARLRQEQRDKLSAKAQLKVLDEKFGKNLEAQKERIRLLQSILTVMHQEVDTNVKTKSNEKKTKTKLSNKEIKKRKKQKNP